LREIKPSRIYKLGRKSSIFKAFCESNLAHTESWKKFLKERGEVGENLQSFDKLSSCSIYNQYVSLYLYQLYKKFIPEDTGFALSCLNQACDLGFFRALTERCRRNQELLRLELKADILAQYEKDLRMLSSLYWGLGSLHAAWLMLDLANHYRNQLEGQNGKNTERLAWVRQFYLRAAEFYYSALLLIQETWTTKIVRSFCLEADLLKVFGYKDLQAATTYVNQNLDGYVTKDLRDELYSKVKLKIQETLTSPSRRFAKVPKVIIKLSSKKQQERK
jgi:hypothetical protein